MLAPRLIFLPVSYCLLNPEMEKRKKGKIYKEEENKNTFQFQFFFRGFSQMLAWSCRGGCRGAGGRGGVELLISIH